MRKGKFTFILQAVHFFQKTKVTLSQQNSRHLLPRFSSLKVITVSVFQAKVDGQPNICEKVHELKAILINLSIHIFLFNPKELRVKIIIEIIKVLLWFVYCCWLFLDFIATPCLLQLFQHITLYAEIEQTKWEYGLWEEQHINYCGQ